MENAHVLTQGQTDNPEGLQTGPKSPSTDGNEPEHSNSNASGVQLPDLLHSDLTSNRGEKEIYKDGSVDVEQADIIQYLRLVIEENQFVALLFRHDQLLAGYITRCPKRTTSSFHFFYCLHQR